MTLNTGLLLWTAFIVTGLACSVVCALKGRWIETVFGLLLPPVAIYGASRPALAGSFLYRSAQTRLTTA